MLKLEKADPINALLNPVYEKNVLFFSLPINLDHYFSITRIHVNARVPQVNVGVCNLRNIDLSTCNKQEDCDSRREFGVTHG